MKRKGFTLIELLAVLVVIAVLAIITTPVVWNYVNVAKKEAYEHQLLEIYKAAQLYFTDNAITIENGESMYVSIHELVMNDYLDAVPHDNFHGGLIDGIVEVTGTYTDNTYQYYDSKALEKKSSIVVIDNNRTIENVVISGKTSQKESTYLLSLANQVLEKSINSEMMKIEGYNALVVDSDDISSVKSMWFEDIFLPNTVYTFHIDSKAIASSTNTIYHPKMRFVYIDGTTSQEYEIGNYQDGKFTSYDYTSDRGKTIKGIEFITDAESPYRFAFNLDTFKLLPETTASYSNFKELKSLADNGIITLKLVNQDGTVVDKKITLLDPLRSIENTNIHDEVLLNGNGTIEVRRRIGKITIDGSSITSNVSIYNNSESVNGYHCFYFSIFKDRISSTYDVMSNALPYVKNTWGNTVNRIGISATSSANAQDYVYVKLPKSEFPTVQSFLDWIGAHPIDVYYELKTPIVETLSGIEFEEEKIKYIYVDSDLSPTITVNYN